MSVPRSIQLRSDPSLFSVGAGRILVASLALFGCAFERTPSETVPRSINPDPNAINIAITIDDLTRHGPDISGLSRTQIAQQMLDVLVGHRVPRVYGFVNGHRLDSFPAERAVLTAWRNAGYPLGNHTYSHIDMRRVPLNDFFDDVIRGEKVLEREMGGARAAEWKVLRFPYSVEGTDLASRAAIRQWLRDHGYRIAPFTVDHSDWAYQGAHARCLQRNDTAGLAELRRRYMNAVAASVDWAYNASQTLFGRQIRHVALMHVGAFSASMMDEYLTHLESRGATYISLDEALADPLYATEPARPVAWSGNFLQQVLVTRPRVRTSANRGPPSLDDLCS